MLVPPHPPPHLTAFAHLPDHLIYLSDKLWVIGISDIILPEVAMNPVAEIQELIIQWNKDICYQT